MAAYLKYKPNLFKTNYILKSMANIKFLPHTADVKYEAYGKTLAEAFESAALAVHKVITQDVVKGKIKKEIKLKNEKTKRSLLYDFIEEIVILMDTTGLLISKAKVNIEGEENNYSLTAELHGDLYKNYECHGAVKSMTYSDMQIEELEGKVKITIVLDI